MIPDIKEFNFPSYATLSHAEVNIPDMGEPSITTQIKIDGEITPDFSEDWEIEFQGTKYVMPLRKPQGAKENTSLNSTIDLTFQHWAVYQLKRFYFCTIAEVEAGTVSPDKYIASVNLNLENLVHLFSQVLSYYFGDKITISLYSGWQGEEEPVVVDISHSYVWDVLIKFYELFAVRWQIEPNGDTEHYVINVGYPTEEINHFFEYGFDGGLLKVERQVQSEDIRNILIGRGGDTNLPLRYFKDVDSYNPDFQGDPDWVPELANIYFDRLRGATFRSYVQGWKTKHYPTGYSAPKGEAYSQWAWEKGYTDEKFDPVEYVADEIADAASSDTTPIEVMPSFMANVVKGSSIDEYGPLFGGLDDNDDIYPTLQGTGMDIAVDVEQITEDEDIEESVNNDAILSDAPKCRGTATKVAKSSYETITVSGAGTFTVPIGKTANLNVVVKVLRVTDRSNKYVDILTSAEIYGTPTINVYDAATGMKRSASGIPAGTWRYEVEVEVHNMDKDQDLNITVGDETPTLTNATITPDKGNTFDIWVKNIWDSAKLSTESDAQYSERVWKPILGDRTGDSAKVVFTTGNLAVSEDYEFTIVEYPTYDTSKMYEGERSHWCIRLQKSDADLESLGKYVPNKERNGKAGDKFVLIGTEMTHWYTVESEKRLDDYKTDQLRETKDIKPTWVVSTDRVRLNNEGKEDALIQQIKVGCSITLFDKRFIGGLAQEKLYVQSLKYTYREPSSNDAALNPDMEMTLGNDYTTSANPVATLQGEVSALAKQVGSISNIEQIVRAVGDKIYLRKDGVSDRSLSPTQFLSLLTSGDFSAGIVGGAGWGFFKDENGNWVLEADRVNVRQEMSVNTLVINQAKGRGGMEIDTAAFMEATRVVDTDNGYVCYFDQKGGSVANMFHVDDVAYCNRWTAENEELKYYRRRVVAVGADYVTLSKTDVNGEGVPEKDDNIIHYGNYTDETRQYVKVRDVVGGGYERYIEELNSVNAAGVEYYFVGKQAGESRWFVGNKDLVPYSGQGDGSYIEYINRKFNLNNVSLSVSTTIGDKTLEEYIQQVSPPVEQEDIKDFVNNIVDPKIEGIQNQIDGVIETWFYNGLPTLQSYPASDWEAVDTTNGNDNEKAKHLGDLYYDNDTGTAYRFSQNVQGGYYWNTITDDAITKALAAAQAAQDTADSKRRVFTSQPVPPYDKGDLWVNATYPVGTTAEIRDPANGKYYNDILRCNTSRATGSFAISDWGLSSNYTDDTTANKALDEIEGYKYIKEALLDRSTTIGGVFLSSLIRLGEHNESLQTQTVWSGLNGIYTKPRDISYWAGGDALDLFNDDDTRKTLADGLRPAAALVRMDGSAYFAKGNIGFRADGSGWLGNDLTGIKFNANGGMTFGSGVTFNVTNVSGLKNTLDSLANFNVGLSTLLIPCDAAGTEITWQEATQSDGAGGIKAKSIKAKVGLWGNEFITAKGMNNGSDNGGGGASALSDLNDVLLSSALAAGDLLQYDGTHWVNVAQSSLKPDLSGYATQEWVESKGYALASSLAAHAGDTSIHVSTTDRTKWDKAASDLSAILGSDSDAIINKWEEVVAFLDTYTEADTLANLLSNKADKTVTISAGAGLTGGGNLSANRTLALAASGVTAATYTKVTVDTYGRVTAGTSLAAADIPTLDIAKISGLATTLATKLDKSVFDDLFEKVNIGTADAPIYAIRAKYGLYTEDFLTARGRSAASSGGGGESYDRLDSWVDYSADKAGYVLSAGLGWDLNARVNSLEAGSALTLVTTGSGNAVTSISKSGTVVTATKGTTFLTEHQSLANYVTLNTAQTITGVKTFSSYTLRVKSADTCGITFSAGLNSVLGTVASVELLDENGAWTASLLGFYKSGRVAAQGVLSAASFVKDGGTNSQFLMADGSTATRHLLTAVGTLGWSDTSLQIATINTLAFWNGCYAGAASNLQYCDRGRFGDIVTQSLSGLDSRYVKKTGDTMTGPLRVSEIDEQSGGYTILAYKKALSGFAADTAYFVGSIDVQGVIRSSNVSLIHYRDGVGNSTIWDSENDGSGSGLDADLLDGNHLSEILSSNVASATKLATARTIWGQSFDGTTNIGGDMTDVGDIVFQNNSDGRLLTITRGGAIRLQGSAGGWAAGLHYLLGNGTAVGYAAGAFGDGSIFRYYFFGGGYDSPSMVILSNGNVGIGTTVPVYKADIAGTLRATGAATFASTINATGAIYSAAGVSSDGYVTAKGQSSVSDERLKRPIGNLSLGVGQIAAAPAWRFTWAADGSVDVGSSAQYWGRIIPELVRKMPHSDYLSLDYGKAALLASVSLARAHRDLAARVAALEQENKRLKREIDRLSA